MNYHLLRFAAKWLKRFFWLAGVYFLIRGHNEPGGGFIAGLIVAAGFVFNFFHGNQSPQEMKVMGLHPNSLVAAGLGLALVSGMLAVFKNQPFMQAQWHFELWLPIFGVTKFGTPFYFDIGVFLVVVGVVTKIFLLIEEQSWKSS